MHFELRESPWYFDAELLGQDTRPWTWQAGDEAGVKGREWAIWAGLLLALVLVFGPGLVDHVRNAADPLLFNDDARQQIFPFYRYTGADLHPDDYFADYYLANMPVGYVALYGGLARIGIDPAALSKVLPYLLLVAVLIAVGCVAYRIGGRPAVWIALGLLLGTDLVLGRMMGGLPRSFAFPFVAGTLAALSWHRVRLAAGLVAASALFYPPAPAICGALLAVWMALFAPGAGMGDGWSWRRRIALLGVTGVLCALFLLPSVVAGRRFGDVVTPDRYAEYPEAAPGGRYGDDLYALNFSERLDLLWRRSLIGSGEPLWPGLRSALLEPRPEQVPRLGLVIDWILVLTLAGWVGHVRRPRPGVAAVASLAITAVVGHSLARLAFPYLFVPERFALYTLPLLTILLVSTAASGWKLRGARAALALQLAWVLIVSAVVFSMPHPRLGLASARAEAEVMEAIASLPEGSLLAGLPTTPAMNHAPYVSRRSVLINAELHQAFHTGFLDEARRRVVAVANAHYGLDLAPLHALQRDFGVTHFYVAPATLTRPVKYFSPFDFAGVFEKRLRARGMPPLVFEELAESDAVTIHDGHWLIDLAALDAEE